MTGFPESWPSDDADLVAAGSGLATSTPPPTPTSLISTAPGVDAGRRDAASALDATPDAGVVSRERAAPPVSTAAPVVTVAPPIVTSPAGETRLPYRGVHLAGGEFGGALPGREGWDYEWPTNAEVDYFVAKGMNTFRIGFMWERAQRTAYGDFEASYFSRLDALVAHATTKGAHVIVEPHNFARYYGVPIGTALVPNAVFADFWRRMALVYRSNPRVIFNLVNEPSEMPTEQWVSAANAAISAIRLTGSTNTVHVPGNGWTGAHSWADDWYGTPNAVAMLNIVDPADRVVFEAHQYLDADSSGEGYGCMSQTVGTQRLQPFIRWLRANGKKGIIGEFAGGTSATCAAAVNDMIGTMERASDVLVGWVWWAAGPAWDDYPFSLEPRNGRDMPQMAILAPHLAWK